MTFNNPDHEQRELGLLCRIDAPSTVPRKNVESALTYREAVQACWALRRIRGATQRSVAEFCGCRPSHMSQYLADEEDKRDMPARYIKAFEAFAGNTFISQWLAYDAKLTVLEELQIRAA